MTGETNLTKLLASISPRLMPDEYVFCSIDNESIDINALTPLGYFRESEGVTLVITKAIAMANHLSFDSVFKGITLTVHSSLDAVGLTAAVAGKLAENNISANVIAAYYHDHIFVQSDKAELAITVLNEFCC